MKPSIIIAAILFGVVPPAVAQNVDARWAPFIGCWDLADGGATTCVAPASGAGIVMTTRVDGKPILDQAIVADGAARAVVEPGCTGSQSAEWSRDGRKLFARAELTCANQPRRTVSGLMLMTGDAAWLDVQAVEVAGNTALRIRRFHRTAGELPAPATSIAPFAGSGTFTIEDVKEAHAKVAPAVLEAALAETGSRFALRARDLIALDDAGVAGEVIDLMVAASYPQKFQVERRAQTSVDAFPPAIGSGFWGGYWGLGYPYAYSYPGYYVDYRDYFSPYGYRYPGAYYYYPGASVVTNDDGEASADGGGRVVNGVGYTRVRTREATTRSDSGNSPNGSSSRGSSAGRGTMTSSGATQSSGGSPSPDSGSSSGGGSSSGSGSSDSGRTAQPR
jgi:hypothetical protein